MAVVYRMENSLVERIDAEVEKRSLLKHPFYQMWSEGKLTVDHLQGYSKEYFQLVKAVPAFVQNIASANTDSSIASEIDGNMKEEFEHVKLWTMFARAIGVPISELTDYAGASKTGEAVAKMMALSKGSFEEAVAAMYAFELELPKISRSKIDGLVKFYGLGGKDALNYFEVHEEADVRHAQTWRRTLNSLPADRQEKAFAAAVESLKAQNLLLDSVQEKYVGMYC